MQNYVKDFTKNNIEEFLKHPISEFKKDKDTTYVKVSVDFYGPAPEFIYDDFTFKGINSYSSYDYSACWRNYVVKQLPETNKTAYVQEFNTSLDNQKLTIE